MVLKRWRTLVGLLFFAVLMSCDLNPTKVVYTPLILTLTTDTLVCVRDTLTIGMNVSGAEERTLHYLILRDNSWHTDTATTPLYATAWQFPDTGTHHLVVTAGDLFGNYSNTDTIAVRVAATAPKVQLSGDTTASVNDTLHFRATGEDSDGAIVKYLWSFDRDGKFWMESGTDSLAVAFKTADSGLQTVRVKLIDNDGLVSSPDSMTIALSALPPRIHLMGIHDTTVNDTVTVAASGADNDGTIVRYVWLVEREGKQQTTITTDSLLQLVWGVADTGLRMVWVTAIDNDSIVSSPDSAAIHIYLQPPVVSLGVSDTFVRIGSSVLLVAAASDSNGTIASFRWSINGMIDTGCDSATYLLMGESALFGQQLVVVQAFDDDGIASLPDTVTVAVYRGEPVIRPHADTTLSSLDTLVVTLSVFEPSGTPTMYYWDIDGGAWDDSTTEPQWGLDYKNKRQVALIMGARNAQGLFATDTMRITYNHPPHLQALWPAAGDTVWMSHADLPGTLSVNHYITDEDNDSVSCTFWWSADSADTGKLYAVPMNQPVTVPVDSLGSYYWGFKAVDAWGHTVELLGHYVIAREYTICFMGHSIVVGYGGDTQHGGFRSRVLIGLREQLGKLERIRVVGPLVTDQMASSPIDDSCLAISGSLGREMLLLFSSGYPQLTADIGVVMFGANGEFNLRERQTTVGMMDQMFLRNPTAHMYMVNSPPLGPTFDYTNSYYNRAGYNTLLADSVAARIKQGYGAFLVNADSILAPGGVFDSTQYFDEIHPNQTGYDGLSDAILRVMHSDTLKVFEFKHEEITVHGQ